jgi:hypothetical protein
MGGGGVLGVGSSRVPTCRCGFAFVLVSTLVIQPDDGLQEGRNM